MPGYLNPHVINLGGTVNHEVIPSRQFRSIREYLDVAGTEVLAGENWVVGGYLGVEYLRENWVRCSL